MVSLGTNAKMTEAAAAMGLTSLEALPRFLERNRANHESYRAGLDGIPGLGLRAFPPGEHTNHHHVIALVDRGQAGLGRDDLVEVLSAEGILARRYFHPGCHRMEPYRSRQEPHPTDFPVTDEVASRVLSLPTGTDIAPSDVDLVVELVAGLVEHGAEATAWARAPGFVTASTREPGPGPAMRSVICPAPPVLRGWLHGG